MFGPHCELSALPPVAPREADRDPSPSSTSSSSARSPRPSSTPSSNAASSSRDLRASSSNGARRRRARGWTTARRRPRCATRPSDSSTLLPARHGRRRCQKTARSAPRPDAAWTANPGRDAARLIASTDSRRAAAARAERRRRSQPAYRDRHHSERAGLGLELMRPIPGASLSRDEDLRDDTRLAGGDRARACIVRAPVEDDDAPVSCDECVDAATIAAMAVARAEVRATGGCRAAGEIFQPCRADRNQAIAAPRTERRDAHRSARDARGRPHVADLRAMARAAYDVVLASPRLTSDAMRAPYDLSCAVAAWNGLEFVARQRAATTSLLAPGGPRPHPVDRARARRGDGVRRAPLARRAVRVRRRPRTRTLSWRRRDLGGRGRRRRSARPSIRVARAEWSTSRSSAFARCASTRRRSTRCENLRAAERWTTPSSPSFPAMAPSARSFLGNLPPEILDVVVQELGWFQTTFAIRVGDVCRSRPGRRSSSRPRARCVSRRRLPTRSADAASPSRRCARAPSTSTSRRACRSRVASASACTKKAELATLRARPFARDAPLGGERVASAGSRSDVHQQLQTLSVSSVDHQARPGWNRLDADDGRHWRTKDGLSALLDLRTNRGAFSSSSRSPACRLACYDDRLRHLSRASAMTRVRGGRTNERAAPSRKNLTSSRRRHASKLDPIAGRGRRDQLPKAAVEMVATRMVENNKHSTTCESGQAATGVTAMVKGHGRARATLPRS